MQKSQQQSNGSVLTNFAYESYSNKVIKNFTEKKQVWENRDSQHEMRSDNNAVVTPIKSENSHRMVSQKTNMIIPTAENSISANTHGSFKDRKYSIPKKNTAKKVDGPPVFSAEHDFN